MGFLTTVTIYNDGADSLKSNANDLADKLYNACCGTQIMDGRNYDSLGSNANLLTLQKPRHADDNTLYLHGGNTVIDVYDAKSDWVIDTFINEMEYHLKRLKKIKKEL